MTDLASSIGAVLPDYEVQRELGRGAMGVVYLGRHRRLGREVAIKEIAGPLADDPDVRSRFLTEARILAALDHPHIVPVYDYVEEAGRCVLIMEALGGGTVWERFVRDGLTLPAACGLALATSAGVAHAHRKGVLHRDIKPENLMFTANDEVKVTDFGIAKVLDGGRTMATIDGSVLGTPAYMSPEQAEGAEVGPPADVYAIGTMLFEFLSGRLPFEGDSPMALLVSRITSEPPALSEVAPSVPGAIAAVVDRAIARSLTERYPTVDDFAEALRDAATQVLGPDWLEKAGVGVLGATSAAPTVPPAGRLPLREPTGHDDPVTAPTPPKRPLEGGDGVAIPATLAPRGPSPVGPSPADAGRIAAGAPPTGPTRAAVRPVAASHLLGYDPGLIRREQLVGIEAVLRPRVPILLPIVVFLLAVTVALVAVLATPSQPAVRVDRLEAVRLSGAPVTLDGATVVELSVPLTVAGLPQETATATLSLHYLGRSITSRTAAPADGVAEIDLGVIGWLIAGPVDVTVTAADAEGGSLGSITFPLVNQREWWRSAQIPGLLLVIAFSAASMESQSRRHRRGRVRSGAAIAAGMSGAVVGAAAAALWAAWSVRTTASGTLFVAAAAGGLAGIALTVVRARLARRRRIRWRHAT